MLENHINSIKEAAAQKRAQNESARQAEREMIDKKKLDDDMKEAEKQFYARQLRTEYAKVNHMHKRN